jgi:hypothetical protein
MKLRSLIGWPVPAALFFGWASIAVALATPAQAWTHQAACYVSRPALVLLDVVADYSTNHYADCDQDLSFVLCVPVLAAYFVVIGLLIDLGRRLLARKYDSSPTTA